MTLSRPFLRQLACLGIVIAAPFLVAVESRAEDPAAKLSPRVVTPAHLRIDRTLRYSCDLIGLRRLPLQPADLTAMTAFIRADAASRNRTGSRLFIERMTDSTAESRVRGELRLFGAGEEIAESADDARLSGKPALHRLARRKAGGWILVRAQKGDPVRGYWSLTAFCEGERADEDLALMRKAIDSFTTDLKKPRPEGMFEDRFFGYRIAFDGFEGPKHHLPAVVVEMCSLWKGDEVQGHFTVWVGPHLLEPDADWAEIRRKQEKQGARLVKEEALKLGDRPVRDVVWETTNWDEKKQTLRVRYIWDDGVRWLAQAILPGHDVKAEGPAKQLYTALEGFRVHDEKPAAVEREPAKGR